MAQLPTSRGFPSRIQRVTPCGLCGQELQHTGHMVRQDIFPQHRTGHELNRQEIKLLLIEVVRCPSFVELLLPLPLLLPQDLRRMQLRQDVLSLLCRFWFRLVWQLTSCPKVGMPWRRLAMWKAGALRMPLRSWPSSEPGSSGVSSTWRATKILPSPSKALKTQSKQEALLSPSNGLRRGTLHRQTCLVTQPKSSSPVPVQHGISLPWSANLSRAVVRE